MVISLHQHSSGKPFYFGKPYKSEWLAVQLSETCYNPPVMNRPWLLLTVVILSALAVACAPLDDLRPGHNTAADLSQIYGASLQDWALPQLETLGPLPHYTIHAQLPPSGDRLEGQMTVLVPNVGPTPWPDLVFRLYPNTPHYGAVMDVTQVHVNGDPLTPEFVAEGAALRLPLTAPLAPGEEVTVDFVFGVDNIPFFLNLFRLCGVGFHVSVFSIYAFYFEPKIIFCGSCYVKKKMSGS